MDGQQIFSQLEVRLTYDHDGKPVPIALLEMGDDGDAAAQFLGRWLLSWRDDQAQRDAVAAAERAVAEGPPADELWQRTWRKPDGTVLSSELYTAADGPPVTVYDDPSVTVSDVRVTTRGD